MPEGFSIGPDRLRCVAPQFADEASRLSAALDTLRSRLDSGGAPWGDDKAGQAFAKDYLPHRPEIERALGVLSQGLASVCDALQAVADNHEASDNASTVRHG